MVVGEIAEAIDFLVIGGGPGGYTAALRAAALGRRVVLVDRDGEDGIGGVCLHVGCIPSKALIELAAACGRVAHLRQAGLGIEVDRIDMAAWQQHRATIVEDLADAVRKQLRRAGVDIRRGTAAFNRADQVAVRDGRDPSVHPSFLRFADVVVATGSRPVELLHLPFDGDRVLDSTGALAMAELPASVAVVGGGYIGIELGTALAKLGSAVTIVEGADRLLPAMDPVISRAAARRLDELGVRVLVGASAAGLDAESLLVETGGDRVAVAADKVVVAVGRRPNTADLGLDAIGVAPDAAGLLPVAADRRLNEHVAAIGDITPGPALAHKATAEAVVAAEALCGLRRAFDAAAVPAVVFCDPEVAVVGLTPAEAAAAGIDVEVVSRPLRASGRAATLGEHVGSTTLVASREDGVVVGGIIVGPHASEQIGEIAVAVEMGASLEDLALVVHPHPTIGELIGDAARERTVSQPQRLE
jgi:dihydrolipoamide dehydrogenase